MTDREKLRALVAKAIHEKNDQCGEDDSWADMREAGYECVCFSLADAAQSVLATPAPTSNCPMCLKGQERIYCECAFPGAPKTNGPRWYHKLEGGKFLMSCFDPPPPPAPALGPNIYRDPDTGIESVLGTTAGTPTPALLPTDTEARAKMHGMNCPATVMGHDKCLERVRLLGSLLEAGDAMNRNAITDDSALYEAQKAWVCAKAAVLAEVRKQS